MAKIQTLAQFRDYVKKMCGMPVINMEVTDDQIDQIIEDSVDYFCRYMYDEGSYMDYAIITFSAGQTEVPMTSAYDERTGQYLSNIQDIYDFNVSMGYDGINTMFSPTHVLLHDQYVNKGNYPGGPSGGIDTGLSLTNYQISMMYLDEISNAFGKMYTLNWLPARESIQIVPTPNQNITGVISFYRRETTEYLYNHIHLKKLVVGRVKKLWGGLNLGKYNATLPDGITINYDNIYNQGKEEEQEAIESIRSESSPIDFFIA